MSDTAVAESGTTDTFSVVLDAEPLSDVVFDLSLDIATEVSLDQTSLTVWPNSNIVLDKYLYDPDKKAGEMALSATRGVLRFIGGKISKTQDVTIKTPHAVVAIRGGMAQIVVSSKRTKVTNIASEYVKLSTQSGAVTLSRPMAAAEISEGENEPRFLGVGGAKEAAELYAEPLGKGSGGSTGPAGCLILPAVFRTKIGGTNNIFGVAYHNQRYHRRQTPPFALTTPDF